MNEAKNFKDLIVWKKAHEFVLGIYKFTDNFPKSELYCLTSRFRRAALSIPSNISERFKKFGKQEKIRYLNIAQRSLEEYRYYLILANDLGYGTTNDLDTLLEEASKLITAYLQKIQKDRLQTLKNINKNFCFLNS